VLSSVESQLELPEVKRVTEQVLISLYDMGAKPQNFGLYRQLVGPY